VFSCASDVQLPFTSSQNQLISGNNVTVFLKPYAMKMYRGVDVQIHIFLTSALTEVSGQLHAPTALPRVKGTTGERVPGTHWLGGWVGPRAGLDDVEKRKILDPTRIQTPTPRSSSP
jgi:hypothetical protein